MKIFQFQNGANARFLYQNKPVEEQTFQDTKEVAEEFRDGVLKELGALNREIFYGPAVAEGFTPEAQEAIAPSDELHNKLMQGKTIELSTGWKVTLGFDESTTTNDKGQAVLVRKFNGTVHMRRTTPADKEKGTPRVKEWLTYHTDGRAVWKQKEGHDREVVKTFEGLNLKKAVNEDVKLKYYNNEENTIRKVKDREENNVVVFDEDGDVKAVRRGFDPDITNPKIEEFKEDVVEDLQNVKKDAQEIPVLAQKYREEAEQIDHQIETLLTNYEIKPGDTLSNIAALCKNEAGQTLSWRTLYEANKGNLRSGNPDLIFPGEKIKLPDGYKLDAAALDAVQLQNLKAWYGEKKALEIRARQAEIDRANAAKQPQQTPAPQGDQVTQTPAPDKTGSEAQTSKGGGVVDAQGEQTKIIDPTPTEPPQGRDDQRVTEREGGAEEQSGGDKETQGWHAMGQKLYNIGREFGSINLALFDAKYDLESIEKNIPNIKLALGIIKKDHPSVINGLADVFIVIIPPNVTKKDLTGTISGRHFIRLDHQKTPEEMAQDIINGTKQLEKEVKTAPTQAQEKAQPKNTFRIEGLGEVANATEQEQLATILSNIVNEYQGKSDVVKPFLVKADPLDDTLYFKRNEGEYEIVQNIDALKSQAPSWFSQYADSKAGIKAIAEYLNNYVTGAKGTNYWKKEIPES